MSGRLTGLGVDEGASLFCSNETFLVVLRPGQLAIGGCFCVLVIEEETLEIVGSVEHNGSLWSHFGVLKWSCGGE